MTVGTLLATYNKCWDSDRSSKFERDFIKSLVHNAHKYCKHRFFDDIFHGSNRDYKINFSEKQVEIYNQIEEKYNRQSHGEDLWHKYSDIFRKEGVVLDNFDKRHLATFKGVFKESENFKKWLSQIVPIKN